MRGAVVDQPALRAVITRFQGFLELTVVWQSKTTALGKAWCGPRVTARSERRSQGRAAAAAAMVIMKPPGHGCRGLVVLIISTVAQ
jgi:hypothetical protein